jgi:hypothetical protein
MRVWQAVIEVSDEEREELTRWSTSRTLPAGDVFKARLILALADGVSYSRIEADLNLRRSRKIAHFRSVKVTHLKNRISV